MLQIGKRLFSHPVKWEGKEIVIFSTESHRVLWQFCGNHPYFKKRLKSQAQELLWIR